MTTKTTEAPQAAPTEAPKPEVMGIERDNEHARVSFTPDGNLVIITIPLGRMSAATAHGFVYLMHDILKDWYKERNDLMQRQKVVTGAAVRKFNFKQGISKLLHGK